MSVMLFNRICEGSNEEDEEIYDDRLNQEQ